MQGLRDHMNLIVIIRFHEPLLWYSLLKKKKIKAARDPIVSLLILIWAALHEKVPNVLSRCHTKRWTGVRGRTGPSFGMTGRVGGAAPALLLV